MTTCSRTGCTKKLRRNNTTGMCATGCHSAEAPAGRRASLGATATVVSREPYSMEITERPATAPSDALAKFRVVAEALGKKPDELLGEFAQAWLEELRAKLED